MAQYPKVNIDPSRFEWAINRSGIDEKTINDRFKKFNDWISGIDQPTMNQLSEFSLLTHIPIGYFFLDNPPSETIELLKYRTLQSHPHYSPSRNMLDTILHMTNLQDWMRQYFINTGNTKNIFVGSLNNTSTVEAISNEIRSNLNIEVDWFSKISSSNTWDNFKYIRNKIQALDIIVMVTGIVGSNTRRSLDINEFRAFAMIDDYVPLIFINAKDTHAGRIFSLIHELAHVAIGFNHLLNFDFYRGDKIYNDIEILCNAIAAEILVPIKVFELCWSEDKTEDNFKKISNIAKYFKVSEVVIARRALDREYISKDNYVKINNIILSKYDKPNKKVGGDSFRTFMSSFDNNCLIIINQCIQTGYLLYTDAYRLTGLSRIFFDKIMFSLNDRS
jgi:Zn-dependent peptidase ImmA (M78 family)